MDRRPAEKPVDRLRGCAVAAEEAVVPEEPQVPFLRDGVLGQLAGADVLELARAGQRLQLREEVVDLVRRIPDRDQAVLGPQVLQDLRERLFLPRGELMGAVVRDLVGRRLEVRPLEPHDRDLGHAEALRRLEPRVPRDHLARAPGDERLLPVEAADRGRDVLDGRVVDPGVGGREEDPLDRDPLDGEGLRGHTDS